MQPECAGIAAFGSEIVIVAFKKVESFLQTGIHHSGIGRSVFIKDIIDDRVIRFQSVKPRLQISCPVVGGGTVPNGIVQNEFCLWKLCVQGIYDFLYVFLVSFCVNRRTFGTFFGTVVCTEHY